MANYIQGLFHGIRTLLTGLKVTGKEFVTPKITEQYPENRATLKMNERFCGTLTMPHDAEGKNKCVACGLCQAACPNGTIKITTETVTDEETGKPRRRLVKYEYDLGACMFCHLCVNACPKHLLALSRTRLNQKGHTPVELTDPDQCVGCAFCATMCPDCVITVEK